MRSLLVDALIQGARELKLWRWVALISIALHILRSC
jgi:L-amino acid N-acyltransferase YncA